MHLGGGDALGLLDLETWRRDWSPEQWAEWLSQGEQDERAIREATYSGRVLGCAEFIARLESATHKKLAAGRPGRPKKEVRAVGSTASA